MIEFCKPRYMMDTKKLDTSSRAYTGRWQRNMFRMWEIARLCGQIEIGNTSWCLNVRKRPEVFL